MLGQEYTVRKGDTLWDLSKKFLGDPSKWPAIYEHNKKSEVIAKTGMRINNPDLIFVDQKIYIPLEIPNFHSTFPMPANLGNSPAKDKFRSIPFKYDFEKIPLTVTRTPLYTATVKLVGTVTIQSGKTYSILAINKDGFDISAKQEADIQFGKLISGASVGWNSKTKKVNFGISLTAKSNDPFAPIVSIGSGISSTGAPSIKISMKVPPAKIIRGKLDGFYFAAMDFGVEIEITQNAQSTDLRTPAPKPQTSPLPNTTTIHVPALPNFPNMLPDPRLPPVNSASPHPFMEHNLPQKNIGPAGDWVIISIVILTIGAVVVVTATIAEDIITLGAGLADDIASFAAAAGMLDKAAKLYRATQAVNAGRAAPAFAF